MPIGGATAWGASGAAQLFSVSISGKLVQKKPTSNSHPIEAHEPRDIVQRTGLLEAIMGDLGTYGFEIVHSEPSPTGILQVSGRISGTDGFVATLPRFRGPIDTASWGRHRWLQARWRGLVKDNLVVTATAKGFEESNGLGTDYQKEHTRSHYASFELSGRTSEGFSWNSMLFVQERKAGRTFSAVDATRTRETPVLNQFAEPITTAGGAWTGTWRHWNDGRTNVGADFRLISSETKMKLGISETTSRERITRADSSTIGLFAIHNRRLARGLRGMVGVRLDRLTDTNGRISEIESGSGQAAREIHRAEESDFEFSPSAGIVWEPFKRWRIRAAAHQSFRQPSLAERYRIIGYRNVIIESNPALKIEHSDSAELAVEYTPNRRLGVVLRGFATEVKDLGGTRRIDFTAVTVPRTWPDSVEARARLNFDRVHRQGAELHATYEWRTFRSMGQFESRML